MPVIGFGTDDLPGFYTTKTGLGVDFRADTPAQVADLLQAKWDFGLKGGVLVTNPVPADQALDPARVDTAISQAVAEAEQQGIGGKDATPFLLARVKDLTGGDSLETNIALIESNARLAARIAAERQARRAHQTA